MHLIAPAFGTMMVLEVEENKGVLLRTMKTQKRELKLLPHGLLCALVLFPWGHPDRGVRVCSRAVHAVLGSASSLRQEPRLASILHSVTQSLTVTSPATAFSALSEWSLAGEAA